MTKAALVQLCSSDDPDQNAEIAAAFAIEAASAGAALICTPEVTNCVSSDRAHQKSVLRGEAEDSTLAALRAVAAEHGVWINIGSLALKVGHADSRFANRSFLIDPAGTIVARYDKAHMFDVDVDPATTFRESAGYAPGDQLVLAGGPDGATLGLTICYDMRFPEMYRRLAVAGADIITAHAAFTVPTGRAHWEVLLRARAIETGSFILAAAQTGRHLVRKGAPRESWGHSLAVSPWGEVLADAGTEPGVTLVDLDLGAVASARERIPNLRHARALYGPL
ncbi:MAG: carbon-nitrogen hydrolase family protein [Pseudomonadota bacterium]